MYLLASIQNLLNDSYRDFSHLLLLFVGRPLQADQAGSQVFLVLIVSTAL